MTLPPRASSASRCLRLHGVVASSTVGQADGSFLRHQLEDDCR
jgi:hypothetical protein